MTSEAAASRLGLEPRARFVSFGLAGVDPVPDAAREPGGVPEGARPRGAQLGRHRRDRGQRGVRVRRAPVRAGRRTRGSLRGHQPERRRHLARSSARRDRRARHRDAPERARAPRGALRDRVHVHRLRPGDRGRGRAPVRTKSSIPACAQLEPHVRADLRGELEEGARGGRAVAVAVPRERDPASGIAGSTSSTRTRSSCTSTARSGTSAAPKPAATRPCTVPLSSERKAISTSTPRSSSSLSARDVLRQARLPISARPPSSPRRRALAADASSLLGGDDEDVGVAHQLLPLERPLEQRAAS